MRCREVFGGEPHLCSELKSMHRSILLIGNLGPRSGTGQYTHSLYDQLKLMEDGNTSFHIASFYNAWLDRLFFSMSEAGLHPLLPVQSGLSVLSHMAHLLDLRGRFDLYHVTDGALSLVSRVKRPSIVTVHDIIPFLNFRPWSIALQDLVLRQSMRNLRHAAAIIANSYHTRRDVATVLGLDPSKIRVIHLGVDSKLFRPIDKTKSRIRLRLPSNKRIILSVGSEEPRKNIPLLVEAFVRIARRMTDAVLIRVGARESEEVARLISRNGLSNKVSYLKLSAERLPYMYSAADALVFPSLYEGFGLPLVESMACGCPIIASNTTSIPEIVGDAGILLDPNNCDAFASAIEKLLTSSDLQTDLAQKGIRQSRKFDWRETAKKTLDVYNEVLSRLSS